MMDVHTLRVEDVVRIDSDYTYMYPFIGSKYIHT